MNETCKLLWSRIQIYRQDSQKAMQKIIINWITILEYISELRINYVINQ